MKRTEPKSFAEIFDENMARAGASDTMARHQACFLWPEIVGPGINKYTYKRYVDDSGCMHVYVSSAPLKNELSSLPRLRNPDTVRTANPVLSRVPEGIEESIPRP